MDLDSLELAVGFGVLVEAAGKDVFAVIVIIASVAACSDGGRIVSRRKCCRRGNRRGCNRRTFCATLSVRTI